jgi:hypothetical protein
MGIDIHGLNFLRYAGPRGAFGATVMIGRQSIYLSDTELRRRLRCDIQSVKDKYAEKLLIHEFGASSVDSIDFSPYEGANLIHNFNNPVPESIHRKYDTIIDFGTLEHVFSVNQALRNCSLMGAPGAQILHVLPANNMCGHGFWQFSPEMFFSLYTEANGYAETEVFLADVLKPDTWFAVSRPSDGHRIMFGSRNEVYILVRAVLKTAEFSHDTVQQSDYVTVWDASASGINGDAGRPNGRVKKTLKSKIEKKWHKLVGTRIDGLRETRFLTPMSVEACLRS